MNRFLCCALLLFSVSSASQAAILADFSAGNGTATASQYPGVAGAGWFGPWGSAGTVPGSTTVVSTSPLNSGGNYLQVTDNATATSIFVRRQYESFGDVDITGKYRISLSFRFDGTTSDFSVYTDRLAIYGDTSASSGTNSTSTWGVGIVGGQSGAGANQTIIPARWYFFDHNGINAFDAAQQFDTGLGLVGGRVYNITVEIDPQLGKYDATIDDGVNPAVSATNLDFRRGAAAVTNWLHVNANASAGTDNSAFSIDNVSITAIPEPAAITAVLSACLGAGWLFGKRLRRKISDA